MNCTINGLKRAPSNASFRYINSTPPPPLQGLGLKYNKYLPGIHLCLLLSQLSVDAGQLGFLLRLLDNQGLYTFLSRGIYIF